MRRYITLCVALLLAGLTARSHALAMGPDEFASARQLTCVLAQSALGYLSEEGYADGVDEVLSEYDDADSDVVFAKALGYYDGLMFGIAADDQRQIGSRLQSFVESQACTQVVKFTFEL